MFMNNSSKHLNGSVFGWMGSDSIYIEKKKLNDQFYPYNVNLLFISLN